MELLLVHPTSMHEATELGLPQIAGSATFVAALPIVTNAGTCRPTIALSGRCQTPSRASVLRAE